MALVAKDLSVNRQQLGRLLRWPENIGIKFYELQTASAPPASLLLVWVNGLAAEDAQVKGILTPLADYRGLPSPEALSRAILLPNRQQARDLDLIVARVLEGYTALLVDGWDEALLLNTAGYVHHHADKGVDPNQDVFARDIEINVALLRKRLRDPRLLALRVPLKSGRGEAALVFVAGKARPGLVRMMRRWAHRNLGEEAASRGILNPVKAMGGLLPRFLPIRYPDKVAMLLDTGYVALLTDRMLSVYVAPVTAPAWVTSPSDFGWVYPLKRGIIMVRLLFYLIILLTPGALIALLNYHVDMVPTAFLSALASARENAPFSIFFEVLFLELLVEMSRESAFRLPSGLPLGAAVTGLMLITLLGVQAGFFGPAPALAALGGALASLAVPSYAGVYLARIWRFYMLLAAVAFGFFGMATVFGLLMTYISVARSWGIPFLGPAGLAFTAPEGTASHQPRKAGRQHHGSP